MKEELYRLKESFVCKGFHIVFSENHDSLKDYPYDVYLSKRARSWGWGTWMNRWLAVDWDVHDYFLFKYNPVAKSKFNEGGKDLSQMLDDYMKGRNDSWAIRWCYAQYKHHAYSICPKYTHVLNSGLDGTGTHCGRRKELSALELESGNGEYRFLYPPMCKALEYDVKYHSM